MRYVVKKVRDQVKEIVPWNNVFLSADMTITAYHSAAAIEAILFLSFRRV
jgi:hypothetical protein